MNCDQFRDSILESLYGELAADTKARLSEHESSCAHCRAELARWREIESALRTGWPVDDPPPLPVLSFRRPSLSWWEVGWRLFSMASAALVAASLVALVVLRPSIQWDGARFAMAFHGPALSSQAPGAESVSQRQVQAWIHAEVQQAVAGQSTRTGAVSPTLTSAAHTSGPQEWSQVRSKLELLDASQAYLWRQVQEQQVNLESLWRNTSMSGKSSSPEHPGSE